MNTTPTTAGTGWFWYDQTPSAPTLTDGDVAMAAGPGTPPAGHGSVKLTVTTPADKAEVVDVSDFPETGGPNLFSNLSGSFSTYVPTGGSQTQSPALKFWGYSVAGTTTPGTFTTLNFEPYMQPGGSAAPVGTWQTWTLDGSSLVWDTLTNRTVGATTCIQANPCTLSTYFATNPDAHFIAVSLAIGSGFTGGTPISGYATNVTISLSGGSSQTWLFDATQPINVSKTVAGDTAGYVGGTTFDIDADCGTDAVTPLTLSLAGGDSGIFYALPGNSCTISETTPTDPAGYTYTVTPVDIEPETFTMPSSAQSVAVTNTLTASQQIISVSKTVTGATAGYVPGTPFSINIDCGAAVVSPSNTLSLADGATGTFSVATGSSCIISETTPTDPPGYTYATTPVVITPANFTVPATGQIVSVTNTLTAQVAPINQPILFINSSFNLPVGAPTISLGCTPPATGSFPNFTVPQGSVCTLTIGGIPGGYTIQSIVYSGTGVDPGTGGFTVPEGGIDNLSVVVNLAATATEVQPIPAMDARSLVLLAILLLGAGWVVRWRIRF